MPIASDNTRVSIDFSYEWVVPETQDSVTWQMKYFYGDYGPTVQLMDSSGGVLQLPAEMFIEVSEFLINQGVVGKKPILQKGRLPLNVPTARPSSSIPLPRINKASSSPVQAISQEPDEVEEIKAEDPIEEKAKAEDLAKERAKAADKAAKADKRSVRRAEE